MSERKGETARDTAVRFADAAVKSAKGGGYGTEETIHNREMAQVWARINQADAERGMYYRGG